jgi:phenylalanyl-tRNA synthetase beta chain
MRVPLTWLREYCNPDASVDAIAERLTMTGTKVEAIHHHGVGAVENFVVGRVLAVEDHPDADRLKVCKVDIGANSSGGPATIVCGAPNVASGQTVAVARPGAIMPDGTTLGHLRLRGVASEGMILSEPELGIGTASDGILVLDDLTLDAEFAPGTALVDVLQIATDVLELEITPNRPDCLGVFGVARELHAASRAPLSAPPWSEDLGSAGEGDLRSLGVEVAVECPDLCSRFTARVFEDVAIAPSPPWLKERLMAAGQRPINNVVDVTNYAMLLTGQPLHAFDLDRVAGGRLTVRRAREGEPVQTLDGHTRTLDSEMVLIEDADGPTSIAGIMGGARSEVRADTRRVLLEVATWSGPNIHRTSSRMGLRSEASSRFEKGLQPEQCMHAQAVATRLMVETCGARVIAGTIDEAYRPIPARRLRLREPRLRAILGVAVEVPRQAEILSALDFQTAPADDGLDVTVPALRRDDVTREVDLIEEVARIDGLDRLPATLPARRGAAGMLSHAQRLRRAAEDAMVGRGLYEVVGWSFAEPALLDRLLLEEDDDMRRVVVVENPLSEAQSIMRPTLLGSLLDAASHNASRNGAALSIFESGTVYRASREGELADEHHALAVLSSGSLQPRSWRGAGGQADFFSAKALLAAMLDKLDVPWSVQAARWPFLHPGRSASVLVGAGRSDTARPPDATGPREMERVGFLGELHPRVADAWGLAGAAVFSVDLGKVADAAPQVAEFRPFASVPPLREDLSVTLPVEVPAADVLERVRAAAGETLENVSIFDVYTGEQVGIGRRSLALALSFRAVGRTLSDDDVAPTRARIVAALSELGGELRG